VFDLQSLIIEHFVEELRAAYGETYALLEPGYGNVLAWAGRLALENIANSDALYHNVEHTIMVSLVGQAILTGKQLLDGGVTPQDWLEFMLALLCHDIGYVRGICRNDDGDLLSTGVGNQQVKISRMGSDAQLKDYHVDRGKQFVRERFGGHLSIRLDVERIISFIEMTRFPSPSGDFYKDTGGYGGLVRAADFIGQMGDPRYVLKTPALFYEFEEIGYNKQTGYKEPGDMRKGYADFYFQVVDPLIQDALCYLRVTHEGKLWIANLHSHVYNSEHNRALF